MGTPLDAEVEALKQRVELEKERGLRLAAEREVQALTAHLATAQQTIRMIEAAPPKVETRVERVEVPTVQRVEVPVVPRAVWALIGVLVLALAAALAAWALTTRQPQRVSEPVAPGTPSTAPSAVVTAPAPPSSTGPVPVIVAPPSS